MSWNARPLGERDTIFYHISTGATAGFLNHQLPMDFHTLAIPSAASHEISIFAEPTETRPNKKIRLFGPGPQLLPRCFLHENPWFPKLRVWQSFGCFFSGKPNKLGGLGAGLVKPVKMWRKKAKNYRRHSKIVKFEHSGRSNTQPNTSKYLTNQSNHDSWPPIDRLYNYTLDSTYFTNWLP